MTKQYFPFASGSGANTTQLQWRKMAEKWLETGVIRDNYNKFEVYADSTGMQVKVKSGSAWIKGHYFESDTEEILPIAPADPTNPRIDRIIIRLDWIANTVDLAVLQGGPAVSPAIPAETKNEASRWEISLATVRVEAGVATIAADKINSDRLLVKNSNESTPASISVELGSSILVSADTLTLIPFATTVYQRGVIPLDTTARTIIVPEASLYEVGITPTLDSFSVPDKDAYIQVYVNGIPNRIIYRVNNSTVGAVFVSSGKRNMPLNKGDRISFYASGVGTGFRMNSVTNAFINRLRD